MRSERDEALSALQVARDAHAAEILRWADEMERLRVKYGKLRDESKQTESSLQVARDALREAGRELATAEKIATKRGPAHRLDLANIALIITRARAEMMGGLAQNHELLSDLADALEDALRERGGALADVERERARQVAKGWTAGHDDEHPTSEMVAFIIERTKPQCMTVPHRIDAEWDEARRKFLVEIAAVAVAAIESIDRRRLAPPGGGKKRYPQNERPVGFRH